MRSSLFHSAQGMQTLKARVDGLVANIVRACHVASITATTIRVTLPVTDEALTAINEYVLTFPARAI